MTLGSAPSVWAQEQDRDSAEGGRMTVHGHTRPVKTGVTGEGGGWWSSRIWSVPHGETESTGRVTWYMGSTFHAGTSHSREVLSRTGHFGFHVDWENLGLVCWSARQEQCSSTPAPLIFTLFTKGVKTRNGCWHVLSLKLSREF